MEEKDGFILHICISLTETSSTKQRPALRSRDQPRPITGHQNPQNGPACCEIYFGSSETKTEFIHFAVMILVEIAFKFGNFMHPES